MSAPAQPQGTEHVVEETIRDWKEVPGFKSFLILNNDGIVIKYENMTYTESVHYAHQVLGLASKASKYVRELFEFPDNEVESLRLRTLNHELIIAQHGTFTVVATHNNEPVPAAAAPAAAAAAPAGGEGEKKAAP